MNAEVEAMLGKMIAEWEQESLRAEEKRIKADPLAHKLTTIFPRGDSGYLFWEVKSRGRRYRYCYSTKRNVAGFYLGWREVLGKKNGKRDMWLSRRVRKAVAAIALARFKSHKQRLENV